MDRLAALLMKVDRRRLAVFPDGWGDDAGLALFSGIDRAGPGSLSPVWEPKEEHPGYRLRRGRATSPVADSLPAEARVLDFEMIEPGTGSDRICVLLPAWNDHALSQRRRIAVALARRRIASVYFHPPFYGTRRVVPEPRQAVRTVADFGRLGYGTVVEALSLLSLFDARRGIAGFSMGATLGALATAASPWPVAAALIAPAPSPAPVYLEGTLRHALSWKALGGRSNRRRLRSTLEQASVLSLPPPAWQQSTILVAARADRFVPPKATRRLAAHWPQATLRWVDGGHAGLARRHDLLVEAVVDAFGSL
jgi:pimeloyl-ACP methyl ester carboxylesterase